VEQGRANAASPSTDAAELVDRSVRRYSALAEPKNLVAGSRDIGEVRVDPTLIGLAFAFGGRNACSYPHRTRTESSLRFTKNGRHHDWI